MRAKIQAVMLASALLVGGTAASCTDTSGTANPDGTLCSTMKEEPHVEGKNVVGGATLTCSVPIERLHLLVKLERRDTNGVWQVMATSGDGTGRVSAPGLNQTRTVSTSAKCQQGRWKTWYEVEVTPVDAAHDTGFNTMRTDEAENGIGRGDCP